MVKIIYSNSLSAQNIMDLDKKLLNEMDSQSKPFLHLYTWARQSITYGCFIEKERYLNLENIKKMGIDLGKRPTGGGIIFHFWDLAFSFFMPSSDKNFSLNTLENYFFVNSIVLSLVKDILKTKKEYKNTEESNLLVEEEIFKDKKSPINFCMAKPTKYDVMIYGKKVAGSAQRRIRQGYLHQGTISIFPPEREILSKILLDPLTVDMIMSRSFNLYNPDEISITDARKDCQSKLINEFKKTLF